MIGKNKRLILKKKEKEIIQHIAKHGHSWYYGLSHKQKVASSKTVLEALKHLEGSLLEIKRKEQVEFMGRKRQYYGLTLQGLHYALANNFIGYKDVKSSIEKHAIKVPEIGETDLEIYLRMLSRKPPLTDPFKAFYRPFIATLGTKGLEKIIKAAMERFPEELFENSLRRGPLRFAQIHLDPLWPPKLYLRNIMVKAMYIVLENYKFVETRAELIDIIGEDAVKIAKMMGEQLEKLTQDEIEFLKTVPPKRRGRILKKLKRTR